MVEPLPGTGEHQQSCPASVRDLLFSTKPQRGGMVRKEEGVMGEWMGTQEMSTFFLTH